MRLQKIAGLGQQHQMRTHVFDVCQSHTGPGHQRDAHPHKGLPNDMQPAFGQQAVHVGHAAIGGILHRQHRQIGAPLFDRANDTFKRGARHGNHILLNLQACLVRISTQSALKGDARGRFGRHGRTPVEFDANGAFRRAKYTLPRLRESNRYALNTQIETRRT